MKKILIVEDEHFKRENIEQFLRKKQISYETIEYVNPALRYIFFNHDNISGIILDLGLRTFKGSNDYSHTRGLNIVYEITRKRLNIPILINSSTRINLSEVMFAHNNVKGQNYNGDHNVLENFINSL